MESRLLVTPKLCIGCKTCELSCSFSHMLEGNRPGTSRIHVQPTGPERHFQMVCLQCEEAACMKACPVGAITMNEATGAWEVSKERCIRCRACVLACPFGNMLVQEFDDTVVKCDLCGGQPVCAQYCPSKALRYEPIAPRIKEKVA